MRPLGTARLLLCPLVCVAAHIILLTDPGQLLAHVPALWETGVPTPAPRQNHKADRKYTMDVDAVMERFLTEIEARRSNFDRIAEALLVFCMWAVLIAILAYCVSYFCGNEDDHWTFALVRAGRYFVMPTIRLLHRLGILEAAAYAFALVVSAQGWRCHPTEPDLGVKTSLVGGAAFAPCWIFSVLVHAEKCGDSGLFLPMVAMGSQLHMVVLGCLAIAHGSQSIGFLAVLQAYVAIASGLGWLDDLSESEAFGSAKLFHCTLASATLLAGVPLLTHRLPLGPFAHGLSLFGHTAYFVAVLLIASRWYPSSKGFLGSYVGRQMLFFMSLVGAFLLGRGKNMRGLQPTAYVFTVLFLVEKELETKWNHWAMKCIIVFFMLHHLYSNSTYVMGMFEPLTVPLRS
mmetsp:Transcript_124909/g.249410  ORF Transcript_124909/g.249410 Transcript_124909/m.249410 type:complete len:402 (+) Transcript_124909:111-1316(+)|eukprot:CAMPEP_0172835228 /NCGR_PEP_ID=MMETSP1075-20121228/25600_1 /TAXON_ID=2916 /ORGANISM="Ceratium fusus, Strain PA161109" /LENGTH=401 /DNA_ID=CAMNT_0013678239 /DNA_START=100 /DNA_END=1305 /DNA_ORIENTATION=+